MVTVTFSLLLIFTEFDGSKVGSPKEYAFGGFGRFGSLTTQSDPGRISEIIADDPASTVLEPETSSWPSLLQTYSSVNGPV